LRSSKALSRLTAFAALRRSPPSPASGRGEERKQPLPFSRRISRPRFDFGRAREETRARGTPGPRGTRRPDRLAALRRDDISRKDTVRNSAKSANSPASRARCLKPAPHDPRWTDLSGSGAFVSADQRLSTAIWSHGMSGGRHRGTTCHRRPRRDARLAHRDRAASAAGAGCTSLHPDIRPPPPVPAS
jgi:hypothetical protein